MDFEKKRLKLYFIVFLPSLKITMDWQHRKHSSALNENQTNNQFCSFPPKLGKTIWICVALPLIQKRPPPPSLQPQCSPQLLLKPNENIRKSSWLPKLDINQIVFSPSVEYHQNTEEIDFPINCNDRLLGKKRKKSKLYNQLSISL